MADTEEKTAIGDDQEEKGEAEKLVFHVLPPRPRHGGVSGKEVDDVKREIIPDTTEDDSEQGADDEGIVQHRPHPAVISLPVPPGDIHVSAGAQAREQARPS